MNRHSKTISNSLQPKIRTMKSLIASSIRPFDGKGYVFKQAISELKKEGFEIVYQKTKCNYVKIKTPNNIYPVTEAIWLA